MSAADPKQPKHETHEPQPAKREERAGETRPEAPIDFSKLDLTIEKVEERISPGETNVFDK